MSKSQIIIIVTGVISVILLFILPKIIVKTEKSLDEGKTELEVSEPPKSEIKEIHKVQVSESEIININKLRNSLSSVLNIEKRTSFADSLVKAFRKIHQYDSAVKYSEMVSSWKPTVERWESTADNYVDASNFADSERKALYSEKARVYYNKILSDQPRKLEVKSKLAMTYVGGEDPMKGIKILREVLKEDEKNESALYSLGILSIQSGQHDKAVKRFEELLSVNPVHAAGQFYLGVAWANLGDKNKAIESFQKARLLDADPEFRSTVDSYIKELH